MLKRRFKIIRATAPKYALEKQAKIVYALTGLYNFIAYVRHKPLLIRANEDWSNIADEALDMWFFDEFGT